MIPIFLVLLSFLPNTALSTTFHSFKKLQLPSPGCEAYTFDKNNGGPYTGLNDGRIVKYDGPKTGFVEYATTVSNRSKELCDGTHGDVNIGRRCGRPLDMEFNHKTGELYVVDLFQGLMVVPRGGGVARQLAQGDGMPVDAPDAIAIDPITDEVYFTDIGTIIFTNPNMTEVLMSGDKSGRLLKYDPKTKKRTIVLTGLAGPAGVAVSRDGSFVVIAEYLACRITRLWLKGRRAGQTEVFAELPGNPDNIKRTRSGDFWVPVNIQKLYPRLTSFPLGQKINPRGQITQTVNFYNEYNSTYITEVHEHGGSLYVASVYTGVVGVYRGSKKLCDGTNGNLKTGPLCGRPLDMEFNPKTWELYVVDLFRGLMVVPPRGGGVARQLSSGDGMPANAPDAVAIDPITGEVYFSDIGSIIFTSTNMTQTLMSGDKSGRLLKYDPKTKTRTVVLTGLAGPAGLAVSRDGLFVLIAEYLACRITRLWLKGPRAGKTEVFAELPGNPDNIKRTWSGDFWVAVNIQKLYPRLTSFPLGQKINPKGQITRTVNFYDEYNATYVTEVHEHGGSLYVASVYTGFVGVYKGAKIWSTALAHVYHQYSYKKIPLPRIGSEAYAFDSNNNGPYTGLNDGRIVKYEGPKTGFVDFAITAPNSNMTEILLSGDKGGRLLKYDPKTKRQTVVLTGLAVPNGVAVSRDASFVLIAEYIASRIRIFWLKGQNANTSNILVRLPGNPDNIKRTKSGDFWVPVNIQNLLPELISFPLGQRISEFGQILETVNFYAEYNATYITEVQEHLGSLYVASVYTDFVSVYKEHTMSRLTKLSLVFVCIVLQLAVSHAKIAVFDEYLQRQANESYAESLKAFNPHPGDLTDEFNELATNPIDRCWRCDPNWAKNRKKLADCARGFGHDTHGGKDGRYYVVTDASDDSVDNPKPGTLRHAVIQKEPLWIVFSHSMVIKLQQELIMTSHKTIDGRGVLVRIAYGAGITIQFVKNIIIHNVWIHNIVKASGGMIRDSVDHLGLRTQSDGDGISIYGSSRVWIDHVSLSKGVDGLIDIIEGSTAITISNCKFNHHNDVMLLGAHDTDSKDSIMQVTIAFNRFGIGCIQRMPRVRWGFAHVVNNDYSHWELYAIGGSAHPTIISQGNRFKAADYQYTKEKWQWRSEGDLFTNGAFFTESGPPLEHKKSPLAGQNLIKFKPGSYVGRLTRAAGAIKIYYFTLSPTQKSAGKLHSSPATEPRKSTSSFPASTGRPIPPSTGIPANSAFSKERSIPSPRPRTRARGLARPGPARKRERLIRSALEKARLESLKSSVDLHFRVNVSRNVLVSYVDTWNYSEGDDVLMMRASELSIGRLKEELVVPEEDKTRCSICMEDVFCGSRGLVMPCRHVYHRDCIE
ncbi:pectin lyase-like superfamily protein, partial [Striga asiatica]